MFVIEVGGRDYEIVVAIRATEADAITYIEEQGARKGSNEHFPDEYWGVGPGAAYSQPWQFYEVEDDE